MPLPKHGLLKKIHMYTGLLSFVSFTIFGIAGLNATFRRSPEERRPNDVDVSYVRFQVPAGLSDRQLAERIHATLRIPLSDPSPAWAVERNRDNNLRISFYTVNGPRRVIVHEGEDRLEIRKEHQSIWQRFSNLHETTPAANASDPRVRFWSYYIEFSTWSLLLMSLSGAYLWLASRPAFRLGLYSLALGGGVFIVLYVLSK